jgi:hypothetical protein
VRLIAHNGFRFDYATSFFCFFMPPRCLRCYSGVKQPALPLTPEQIAEADAKKAAAYEKKKEASRLRSRQQYVAKGRARTLKSKADKQAVQTAGQQRRRADQKAAAALIDLTVPAPAPPPPPPPATTQLPPN